MKKSACLCLLFFVLLFTSSALGKTVAEFDNNGKEIQEKTKAKFHLPEGIKISDDIDLETIVKLYKKELRIYLIIVSVCILVVSLINMLGKQAKIQHLYIFYAVLFAGMLTGSLAGAFAGLFAGMLTGMLTGGFAGLWAGLWAGGFAGKFAGAFAGSLISLWAGGFAGAFAGSLAGGFAEKAALSELFIFVIIIITISFAVSCLARRIRFKGWSKTVNPKLEQEC